VEVGVPWQKLVYLGAGRCISVEFGAPRWNSMYFGKGRSPSVEVGATRWRSQRGHRGRSACTGGLRKREGTLDVGGQCIIDGGDRRRWSTAEIFDIGGSEGA